MTTEIHKRIFIFGASGHAKVVIDLCEKSAAFAIQGVFDLHKKKSETFCGYPILGSDADFPAACERAATYAGLVALGDNTLRQRLSQKLCELVPHFSFVSVAHPFAHLGARVSLGPGSVVLAGAVVNCDTRIGQGCVINTRASLDHDCSLADFVSIAPGATLGGQVQVGERTLVGLGASVIQNTRLGRNSLVGAGAVVVSNIGDNVLAVGVPAKVVRTRAANEAFF